MGARGGFTREMGGKGLNLLMVASGREENMVLLSWLIAQGRQNCHLAEFTLSLLPISEFVVNLKSPIGHLKHFSFPIQVRN